MIKKPAEVGAQVACNSIEATLAAQVERASQTASNTILRCLGDYLVQHGFITLAQLHQGLARQAELHQQGQSLLLGEVLVQRGYLQRAQLARAVLEWYQEFDTAFR